MVAGMALAYFLNTTLSDESMASWGWRIPFLIAAPLGLIGYYIRTKVSETPQFIAAQEEKQRRFLESSASRDRAPSGSDSSPAAYVRLVLLAIGVMAMNSTAFYVLISYLPTYLIGHVELPRELALITTGIYATALFCLLPIAGRVCDRIGRKKTLLASTISFGVIAYPSFLLITHGTFLSAILGQLMMVFPAALGAVMLLPAQMELFTTTVRYRGTAISTGFGAAVFGGSTPFLAEFLATTTGSNMVPALLLVIAASVGFVTALFLKETAHSTLPQ
jgi:MHS family proline/betaine transporter-like MFS transporter